MKRDLITPEQVWKKVCSEKKNLIIIGLVTWGLGILLYIPIVTEWLANPDCVWEGIVFKNGYGWENALGRIGLEKINKVKGFFQYPSAQTIFNLFLIGLITILICMLFDISNTFWGILIGAFMIASPSLCSTLTYYYTADAYLISYLAAVLFVVLSTQEKKRYCLLSVVLLAFSLCLYQAYVGSAITLCLLYLLFLLLKKDCSWQKTVRQGMRFLVCGASGILLYLMSYRFYCMLSGVRPVEDRGFSSMGSVPWTEVPNLVKMAYGYFFDYYLTDNLCANFWHFRGECNFGFMVLILLGIGILIWKKRLYLSWQTLLIAILAVLLLPLGFMSIVVMAPEVSIEDVTGILMLPHMNYLYIFLVTLIAGEKKVDNLAVSMKWVTLALSAYMILTLGMYTQVFQNCMKKDLDKSCALAQRIVIQVESLPEYYPGMKLIIGGRAENGNYPRSYQEMYYVLKGSAAEYGYFWDTANGRQNCWNNFLRQYLGVEYSTCSMEELTSVMESGEYSNMGLFPEDGSVRMIGDCAVVKLSDW